MPRSRHIKQPFIPRGLSWQQHTYFSKRLVLISCTCLQSQSNSINTDEVPPDSVFIADSIGNPLPTF